MRTDYPDGSFMLAWQKMYAWYTPIGILSTAVYRRSNGTNVRVSEKHTKVMQWLHKQGENEINLLNRGILKRKCNVY